jgi:hypothetical protein
MPCHMWMGNAHGKNPTLVNLPNLGGLTLKAHLNHEFQYWEFIPHFQGCSHWHSCSKTSKTSWTPFWLETFFLWVKLSQCECYMKNSCINPCQIINFHQCNIKPNLGQTLQNAIELNLAFLSHHALLDYSFFFNQRTMNLLTLNPLYNIWIWSWIRGWIDWTHFLLRLK